MAPKGLQRIAIVLLVAGAAPGCKALFGRSAEPPPAAAPPPEVYEEESGDAEAGVSRLTALMKQFGGTLQAKNFEAADKLLKRAERGIEKASGVTRAHPDFEDVAERVHGGRPRLDAAIERDRIERRSAAIDALIRQGELAMQNNTTLLGELASRPPQDTDLEHLDEALHTLAQLKQTGEGYVDEARYRKHAEARDAQAARLAEGQNRAKRQLQAVAAVTPAIEAGIAAANRAKAAANPNEQLGAYKEVAEQFAGCASTLAQMRSQPGFDANLVLDTRLGRLDAAQTQNACAATSRQALERVNRFAWENSVNAVLADLSRTTASLRDAKTPAERESANQAALSAARDCENNSQIVSRQPGFDAKLTFATPYDSKLTAAQLVQRCASEATRLNAAVPALHWQSAAASLPPRLQAVQAKLGEAAHAEDPSRQAEAYSQALGGLQECIARSRELLGGAGASKGATFETPWGALTMAALGQRCHDEKERAEKGMAQALGRAQAQTFLVSCHGDEVDVVRREGVPTRIEVVPQGRLFIYTPADGRGAAKRFGFNKDGGRVDFTVQWKTGVEALVAQLATLLPPARGSGGQALAGITAAMPVLESCQSGNVTERHPGFDEAQLFETPFGKQRAAELRKSCSQEIARLRARAGVLSWQSHVEALRDRVAEAKDMLQTGGASPQPDERAQKIGTALGGFTECAERAGALQKAPGADKKYKVESAFGPVTVAELEKSCKKVRGEAEKSLEKALVAVKLQQFLQTCHGDEAAVAERDGMPGKIEPVGGGRVFVYGARRLAFDASGHRTEEKLLRGK